MKKNIYYLLLTQIFCFVYTSVHSQNPFIGSWLGNLNTSGIELRIAFHISENDGIYITKMDSPDQNSFSNPAHKTIIDNDSITIEIPLMGIKYNGKYIDNKITGIFHQLGNSIPLELNRFEGELLPPQRPQLPKEPFSYKEKEVSIQTKNPDVKISGTLSIPSGKGPFPAVVLISGSGPQNRNESLLGHDPFWVLADYLAENGIMVLRYDDRGVGKSTGNFNEATTLDFAEDAEAVWQFLAKQKKVDQSKIGIIGHSEGGIIAPILASSNKDVGFIILMGGPSVPGSIIIRDQTELIQKASGTSEAEIEKQSELNNKIIDFIMRNENSSNLQNDLAAKIEEWIKEIDYNVPSNTTSKSFAKQAAYSFTSKWVKTLLTISPSEYIKDVACPILALYGEKDLQVSPRANLVPMQQLLVNKPNSKVIVLPKLNHLFQTAKTGSPSEYQLIEETLSPIFLTTVLDWIKELE